MPFRELNSNFFGIVPVKCGRHSSLPDLTTRGLMFRFLGEILVPLRNFDDKVACSVGYALASQSRFCREARGVVELMVVGVGWFVAGLESLVHEHVARGAGANASTRMVQPHVK